MTRYAMAVAAMFTNAWSKVPERPRDLFLYLLGLAIRFVAAFPVCLWLYATLLWLRAFLDALWWCFGDGSSRDFATDVSGCPVFAMLWATGLDSAPDDSGMIQSHYLPVAIITLVIALVWGMICRRHCKPVKDWF